MSIEDTIGSGSELETCVVCGKALKPDDAFVKMHQGERKLLICCPLCLEAYQKDPKPYLERLAKQTLLCELKKAAGPPPPTEGGPRRAPDHDPPPRHA